MQWISELSSGGVALLTLAGSAIVSVVAYLWSRFRKRTVELRYQVVHEMQVTNTGQDVGWGELKATWQGVEVPNIHFARCTLENDSNVDLENLEISLQYDTTDVWILLHFGRVEGSLDPLPLAESYAERSRQLLNKPEGTEPAPEIVTYLKTRRDFIVPVLNRGTKVHIHLLVTNTGAGQAILNVACIKKGVRVTQSPARVEVFGVPRDRAVILGLIIGFLMIAGLVSTGANRWISGTAGFVLGAGVLAIGAGAIKLWRGFLRVFG